MHFCEKLSANCTVVLEKSVQTAPLCWKNQRKVQRCVGKISEKCNAELEAASWAFLHFDFVQR